MHGNARARYLCFASRRIGQYQRHETPHSTWDAGAGAGVGVGMGVGVGCTPPPPRPRAKCPLVLRGKPRARPACSLYAAPIYKERRGSVERRFFASTLTQHACGRTTAGVCETEPPHGASRHPLPVEMALALALAHTYTLCTRTRTRPPHGAEQLQAALHSPPPQQSFESQAEPEERAYVCESRHAPCPQPSCRGRLSLAIGPRVFAAQEAYIVHRSMRHEAINGTDGLPQRAKSLCSAEGHGPSC